MSPQQPRRRYGDDARQVLTFRVSRSEAEALDRVAERQGVTRSQLIRDALAGPMADCSGTEVDRGTPLPFR